MPYTRQAQRPTVVAVLAITLLAAVAETVVPATQAKNPSSATTTTTTTTTISPEVFLLGADNINKYISNNEDGSSLAVLDLLESTMQTYHNYQYHRHEARDENKQNHSYIDGVMPIILLEDETTSSSGFVPNRLRPAYSMQGSSRRLRVPDNVYKRAVELVRNADELTIASVVRQERANTGSIVSFSLGTNRYLELESSGRKDEVRLHYIARGSRRVEVEVFSYPLADGHWHAVALTLSGTQARLYVDCQLVYTRTLAGGSVDTSFSVTPELYVGQRNQGVHSVYKGILQDVQLIRGIDGHRVQCPKLDTSCPSCGQFAAMQNVIGRMLNDIRILNDKFEAAQREINQMRSCECRKPCIFTDERSNNTIMKNDGSVWQNNCEKCSCLHGRVECAPVTCMPVTCPHPVRKPGECCDSCLTRCLIKPLGQIIEHGTTAVVKINDGCLSCSCDDGLQTCNRVDTEKYCPVLDCDKSVQISVPEQCCNFCPDDDHCARGGRHSCHPSATCINVRTTHKCSCTAGYNGTGLQCDDIDECSVVGGKNGHHCHANSTICINTPGSYTCKCREGYVRYNSFECIDENECTSQKSPCHPHAKCTNTLGGYSCQCADGYEGDGFTCRPICRQNCLNGGVCQSPDVCSCPAAFEGPACELDVDECATGVHGCIDSSSHCVNMAGWYYCACNPGYQSIVMYPTASAITRAADDHINTLDSTWSPMVGTICQDIDECSINNHTCHPSTICVNTIGSYECHCHQKDTSDGTTSVGNSLECKSSCLVKANNGSTEELENGSWFMPQECTNCTCVSGNLKCGRIECDCSNEDHKKLSCCAKCDAQSSCSHQEIPNVWFHSGQQWVYQCQTCECLMGQVDCWPMQCPPLLPQGVNCTLLTPALPTTKYGNRHPISDCCLPKLSDLLPASRLVPVATAAVALVAAFNPNCIHHYDGENDNNTLSATDTPCFYEGRVYQSGARWDDPADMCTSCNCKNGKICCSYDVYRCDRSAATPGKPHGAVANRNSGVKHDGHLSRVSYHESSVMTSIRKTTVAESRQTIANKRSGRSRRQLQQWSSETTAIGEHADVNNNRNTDRDTNDGNTSSDNRLDANEDWWRRKTRRRRKNKRRTRTSTQVAGTDRRGLRRPRTVSGTVAE
ncbi:protein kinase C-binding protein NELL2-like isoform X2 [Adelges cooleyi]|uniref:protein kinase C-binding protein NELL2-like isoform X2 n=1 Tax=Adelges cooleyi TaxID=133065 RepID=UPI00217FB210|nr:protein kinase C-binding protein NELL2-like isoform X2 [Adelges cooleyi]